MIIIKGNSFRFEGSTRAEAILFVYDGSYCYVESDIVENELRVLRNWKTAGRPNCNGRPWLIFWSQGTEIPQELGDWLVAHQNNNQTPDESEQPED